MNRYRALLALTCTLVALSGADAQDADSPYRIALRNVAPFVPERGAALEEPQRDATIIHVLVQLEADEIERARTQPEAQARLRRLFTAAPDAPFRLHRKLQSATYEAVISRELAAQLRMERSLAPLAQFNSDAAALVRWVGSVPREAKLETALLNRQYEPWGLGPNDTFNLLVTLYEDAACDPDTVFDGLVLTREPYAAYTWRVVLARDRLDELVAKDCVRSVAMGPKPFTALSDLTRTTVDVNTVQNADETTDPPTYQGLTGAGITVAVMDTGVTAGHDDFWEHDAAGTRTDSRVYHQTTTPPILLHGTHVAGIIAGSGYQSMRNNASGPNGGTVPHQWRGMAPHAKIASFSDVNSGGDAETQYQATVVRGADISNESHEQEECLKYDDVAEIVDALVLGTALRPVTLEPIPRRAAIWGAGNNGMAKNPDGCQNYGYFGLTVAAKNPIVVGATNVDDDLVVDNDYLALDSSLGPTYDGRIKPDVVAPGCALGSGAIGIKSTAMPQTGFSLAKANGYVRACGTSQAAAVVSGIAALLLEKWREELESTGDCEITSSGECFPLPSTLKALLIQGARDRKAVIPYPNWQLYLNPDTRKYLQYHEGPDYATGYGLVDAAASVAIVDAGVVGPGSRVLEGVTSASAPLDEYFVVVPMNAPRLRVTLAWDDEPGNLSLGITESQLVNDLDLELVSQSNAIKLPWTLPTLNPNPDAASNPSLLDTVTVTPAVITAVDDRNNVEQVEILPNRLASPPETSIPAGTYRVRVKGGKLDSDKSQEYSLASDYPFVSALGAPAPPPPPGAPPGTEPTPCRQLDWDRAAPGAFAFDFEGGSCGFIPLEPMCRYVVNCAVCDRFGLCPAIRISLLRVPEFFRVAVRRRDGTRVAGDDSRQQPKTLSWQLTAGEEYGLFFDVVGSDRRAERHTIGIEVSTPRAVEDPG